MADIINGNTWKIEDNGVRFFLLTGEEKALMIDTGMKCPNAKNMGEELTNLPIELINTHADGDHVSGNNGFERFYIHPAEDKNLRDYGVTTDYISVSDGQIIDLGNRPLKIIEIPGHTPGSICILDINARMLFSGDTVQDSHIFMFGEKRNISEYINSLKKLQGMTEEFDLIYPSHGTIPVKPEIIHELIDAATMIKEGKSVGKEVDIFGNKVMLHKFECAGFLCEN